MGFLRPRFSVILAVSDKPEPNIGAEFARAEFARAMRDIYVRAKSEAGYNATYFLQMLFRGTD
jgi:hypothetical protein